MALRKWHRTSAKLSTLARPSRKGLILAGLIAFVLSVFLFPFVFHTFGTRDNPFDSPIELVGLAVLFAASFVCVLLFGLARRGLRELRAA